MKERRPLFDVIYSNMDLLANIGEGIYSVYLVDEYRCLRCAKKSDTRLYYFCDDCYETVRVRLYDKL